jgi:ABC-type amino acid transport substrate-binding protein
VSDALPSESGVARILRDGVLRVGTLYNEPPFGELSIRDVVVGFDADLARALGTTWGLPEEAVRFTQVTRQNAIETLERGEIDLLIAAQPHLRQYDGRIEFSQAYYPSSQSIILRNGDGATVLAQMAERKVGVIMGTRGENAVRDWQARVDYPFTVQSYYTLDEAMGALNTSQVDGVIENRVRLERVASLRPDVYRIMDDPVLPEPFAIGLRRQDANLRDAVNRALQFLFSSGRLDEIHRAHFNGAVYPGASFTLWNNVGADAPRLDQFGTDFPFPSQYVVPRLQTEGVLRVAGLDDLPGDASDSRRRLDGVSRALVNALAARWNVTVSILPNTSVNALDLVANGEADLAVGVVPDWASAARVDYTSAYLRRGLLLMVESNASVSGIVDLRGRWIGTFYDEAYARDVVRAEAERARAIIEDFFTINREQDAAYGMLVDNNYDAVMGDSLRLLPHVEANPQGVRFVTGADGAPIWYSRAFVAMALPRNDIDFRLLVEYTLQALARDSTLASVTAPATVAGAGPVIEMWAGPAEYLGFRLG